jgi:hypothetical protein
MYRPQFAYRTPKDAEDHRCHFSFDATNTPFLVGNLGAGLATGRIPLLMDSDADFFLRAIQIQDRSLIFPFPSSGFQVRLEDCYGNPLSDSGNSPVVAGTQRDNYVAPALFGEPDGAGLVALESDEQGVYCPRSAGLSLYVLNPTAAPISLANIIINLHGVKRYSGEKCA